jgi:hypothetical protein
MRRLVQTALMTLNWLLLSPTLQLPERGFVEVGATPAAAQDIMVSEKPVAKSTQKKSIKKTRPARVGSSGVVTSNQPGKYPIRPITAPQSPVVTGTVTRAPDVPGFPNVPSVPVLPNSSGGETSQDRVVRCTHQGALGGLPPGQQGAYIQNCAF